MRSNLARHSSHVVPYCLEATMATLEIPRGQPGNPTNAPVARRASVREANRRRAKDHGRSLARRGMVERRVAARREIDEPVSFLPLLD
jgi:hypothetical protein